MTSSTNHEQQYQQAQTAYIQGNYEEAATFVDRLIEDFPADPNSRLLRGHIYCVLRQYEIAREQYQTVLQLTQDPELIDCAKNGLESVKQYESSEQNVTEISQNRVKSSSL
jgi:twitching motility protein PilJ